VFLSYDVWKGTDVCTSANVWTRPLIALIPNSWRLLQCLRRFKDTKDKNHLKNAGKYCTGLVVAVLSALRSGLGTHGWLIAWALATVGSTIYTFSWDLIKDWGLGNKDQKYLRAKLLYKNPKVYYFSIFSNLIARVLWTLTISPGSIGIVLNPLLFATLLGIVEIARRAQWNLYRLENEQLSNSGKLRAINIPVSLPELVIQ